MEAGGLPAATNRPIAPIPDIRQSDDEFIRAHWYPCGYKSPAVRTAHMSTEMEMNTCLRILTMTVAVIALVSAPGAFADEVGNDSGLYLGASYGGYSSHGGDFDDDKDLAEVIAGYRFGDVLALQAGYIDFGNFGDNDVNAELKGVSLALIGRLPLSDRFGLYAKGGAFAHSLDVDAFDESETYDDVDPFVGLGADYRFSPAVSAYLEYNRYNVEIDGDDFDNQIDDDGPDFDTAQIGLRYQF